MDKQNKNIVKTEIDQPNYLCFLHYDLQQKLKRVLNTALVGSQTGGMQDLLLTLLIAATADIEITAIGRFTEKGEIVCAQARCIQFVNVICADQRAYPIHRLLGQRGSAVENGILRCKDNLCFSTIADSGILAGLPENAL